MRQSKFFQFEEDPFSKGSQDIAFIMHGGLLIMKFSQTKPQITSKNENFYDLYFTILKKLSDEGRENWDLR